MATWPIPSQDHNPSSYSKTHEKPNDRLRFLFQEKHKRGDVLFLEGDQATHLIHILEGFVKLVKHGTSGKDSIVGVYGPGDLLGEMNLLDREPYHATAVVMTPAVIAKESFEKIYRDFENNPRYLRNIAMILSKRLRETQNTVQTISTERVEKRIAALLLKFAEKQPNCSGCTLRIPLMRQEVAEMVGATIETTIRILSRFIQDGAVLRMGRKLILKDLDYLEAVSMNEN